MYLNGLLITEIDGPKFSPKESGIYIASNYIGECEQFSEAIDFVVTAGKEKADPTNVAVYPNPIRNHNIHLNGLQADLETIIIFSPAGKILFRKQFHGSHNSNEIIELPETISPGLYYLVLINGHRVDRISFVIG